MHEHDGNTSIGLAVIQRDLMCPIALRLAWSKDTHDISITVLSRAPGELRVLTIAV